jgi:creatinine amidohydrolase
MLIAEMNWSQVEDYLRADDRCIVPLGSTEQHAQLSLATDSLLSERIATEAAEPLGIPVFPVLAYGVTPHFVDFPGTVSLRLATYLALLTDILDSLKRTGFRRILLCNAHGGNMPAATGAIEWVAHNPDCRVRFHNWWIAPRTLEALHALEPLATHASWSENFPWTRLPNIRGPETPKPPIDVDRMRRSNPAGARALLGDGSFGGSYQRDDAQMEAVWAVAVAETRAILEEDWG